MVGLLLELGPNHPVPVRSSISAFQKGRSATIRSVASSPNEVKVFSADLRAREPKLSDAVRQKFKVRLILVLVPKRRNGHGLACRPPGCWEAKTPRVFPGPASSRIASLNCQS